MSDLVTVVVGSATPSLRHLVLRGELERVAFLFLDRAEKLYVDDFKVCEKLGFFGRGTLVVADNVARPAAPGYRLLVREMQEDEKVKSQGVRGVIEPGGWRYLLFFSFFT